MTKPEFNAFEWCVKLSAIHKEAGKEQRFEIGSVDFGEHTIGLCNFVGGSEDLHWARCENIIAIIDDNTNKYVYGDPDNKEA